MENPVHAILKERLSRSDREDLLDDPRRLAEIVRENLGFERMREAACLNTVLQAGVPKRLLGLRKAELTGVWILNCAKQISANTGLKDDAAHWAIATWAFGLGLETVPGPDPFRQKTQPSTWSRVAGFAVLAILIAVTVFYVFVLS